MSSVLELASRRTSVALTMLLVVLLPSLLITTPDALTLAVLAVACAALVSFGPGGVALAARAQVAIPATSTAAEDSRKPSTWSCRFRSFSIR